MLPAKDWMKDVSEPERNSETSSCLSEKESASHQRSPSPLSSSSSSSSSSESDYENDYDFTKASNPSSVVPMEQQPKVKNFYILNPKDQGLVPFQVEGEDAKDIYKIAGEKLKLKPGKYTIVYPIRRVNGMRRFVTVSNDDQVELSSTNLYCQTESESTIKVLMVGSSRKVKNSEKLFKDFCEMRVISSESYKLFDKHIYVLEQFVEKLKFTRIWLGSEVCVNFVNPCKMLCPLFKCRDDRTLKRFNDLGYVYDHLIKHKVSGDVAATKLVERYNYLKEWIVENKFTDVTDGIAVLASSSVAGKSLSLDGINLFCPSSADKFKGKQYLMDETVIENFILGDVNALASVNPPITSYFVKAPAKRKSSSTITSSSQASRKGGPSGSGVKKSVASGKQKNSGIDFNKDDNLKKRGDEVKSKSDGKKIERDKELKSKSEGKTKRGEEVKLTSDGKKTKRGEEVKSKSDGKKTNRGGEVKSKSDEKKIERGEEVKSKSDGKKTGEELKSGKRGDLKQNEIVW